MEKSVKLMLAGFVLLVTGVALPFLMVLELIRSTFLLNFIAYACSTTGLVLGFIGIAQHVRTRR